MLTFNQLYSEAQNQTQDTDATSLVVIQRGINQGMRRFGAVLNRDWRLTDKTFSLVANQQFYQMPEDAIRVKTLTVTVGGIAYPMDEIADDAQWQNLNMRVQTSSYPRYYYVKGNDQFGIWPIPSGAVSNGGTLVYERSMRDMTAADYSAGSVTMTAGSAAVLGSGTTFTANMVGRVLFVTDGSADGMGYKISAFTDTTHITLENNYGGTAGAGKTYLVGEVPDIPEEFHEALIDYGLFRYYRRRRDLGTAKEMLSTFNTALAEAQADYSSKTSSQYIRTPHTRFGYSQYSNVNRSIP